MLWQDEAYSWTAQTVMPSITLRANASLFSRMAPAKHEITRNSWQPDRGTITVSTIFSEAKQQELTTVMVAGRRPLEHLAGIMVL